MFELILKIFFKELKLRKNKKIKERRKDL